MSKNRNRAKLNKAECGKNYKRILLSILYPKYYEEGYSFYKKTGLLMYEVRMYRTWKYNRKKQYKMKTKRKYKR